MSSLLRVNPDELEQRAGEYRTQGENVENVISALDNLISALESEWEGNSASRYISQYNDLRPSFVSMRDLVMDLSDELKKEAQKFRDADQ